MIYLIVRSMFVPSRLLPGPARLVARRLAAAAVGHGGVPRRAVLIRTAVAFADSILEYHKI